MMKDRAAEGDDLAKLVQECFGDKPDSLLLRFLRARKFNVVRAHELMKGASKTTTQPDTVTAGPSSHTERKAELLAAVLASIGFDLVSADIFQ